MVKNLWKQIEVICGNHDSDFPKMYLKEGHRSMFYACPKYYPDNHSASERACKNNVSTDEFQKILQRLADEIEDQMYFGGNVSLQNMKFTIKSIYIEVVSHKDDKIIIKVKNIKALD